jgi:hypothetical protein
MTAIGEETHERFGPAGAMNVRVRCRLIAAEVARSTERARIDENRVRMR